MQLTTTPTHVGDICNLGIFCVAPSSNRNLLDFNMDTIDPKGCAHIAFADDNTLNALRVANQTAGCIRPAKTHGIGPHYNFHVQAPPKQNAGDVNNYHLRYAGKRIDPADGVRKHTWAAYDSVHNTTEPFYGEHAAWDSSATGCDQAALDVAWQIASYIAAASPDNHDPLAIMTQVGADSTYHLDALQGLCQQDRDPPGPGAPASGPSISRQLRRAQHQRRHGTP